MSQTYNEMKREYEDDLKSSPKMQVHSTISEKKLIDKISDELEKETFTKHDNGKNRLELIDPDFIQGLGAVLSFGATKYQADNWKKMTAEDLQRVRGALLRHQLAHQQGEVIDEETGLNHMYSVACNAMFLAYFDNKEAE